MIKLTKRTEPEVLSKNSAEWTKTIEERISKGEEPTSTEKGRYRHWEIKKVLIEETSGKCAYCESKLRHIAYGDVEHITPKGSDVKLTFLWTNLTLACDICNTNKSDHFKDSSEFVDPYTVNPDDHLYFCGPLLFSQPASDRGALTERILDLNRIELIEKRKERLLNLRNQIESCARTLNPTLREILRKDIELNEMAEDKEYAALSRTYLTDALKRL